MLQLIQDILTREGGYVDRPVDRGGPTKYGITMPTLMDWRGKSINLQDLQNLTVEEAADIYQSQYVKPFIWAKDRRWFELAVDCGVNHGVYKVNKWLSDLKVKYQIFDASTDQKVYLDLCAKRLSLYANLVWSDPKQSEFIKGWINRVNGFLLTL